MLNDFQKFWFMLIPAQRRAAILLLGLMLIGMVLETLGIGLIFPIVAVISQKNLVMDYPTLAPWLDRLDNPSHEQLVVFLMVALVGVYAIKGLFLVFLLWRQSSFLYEIKTRVSLQLFTGYLRQPYVFHLQRNSAELIRNAMTQSDHLMHAAKLFFQLLSESFVLLGILALTFVIEPVGALLVISTFGLVSWGFYRFTRDRSIHWGKEFQYHEGFRIQYLQEGLGAAKDIKLLGREKEFLDRYKVRHSQSMRYNRYQFILGSLPKFGLEFLAVSGMTSMVVLMIIQNRPMDSLVPTLGLFAAAAFRLIPSVNGVLTAFQGLPFLRPVIQNLHREIGLFEETGSPKEYPPLSFEKNVVLEGVSFSYPSTEKLVLDEINLSIKQGESVGFIGSTGAGKSTLVDIILALLTPVKGVVKVDGVDILSNPRGWQDKIGYVPQTIFLTDDTIRRNIAFGLPDDQIEDAMVWSSLRAAQLEQFIKDLPEGLDTLVGEAGVRLSGGQRQRIGIARALYHNPSVLVLDEATSSLDTATESDFLEVVYALKGDKTLIIVAHRLSTVEHCDYLFKIEKGRIVKEGKAALLLGKTS